jgi:hypothetical protein
MREARRADGSSALQSTPVVQTARVELCCRSPMCHPSQIGLTARLSVRRQCGASVARLSISLANTSAMALCRSLGYSLQPYQDQGSLGIRRINDE